MLETDSITKTEHFGAPIHTVVLGVGESHKVHTKTEKAYLFWFIPVHSQTLIDSYEADPESLVGTYYGNNQDNTFIGLTSEDIGPFNEYRLGDNITWDIAYAPTTEHILLHNYTYHLFGRGGNDSFLLGPSDNYVEGGAGADKYIVEEVVLAEQYNGGFERTRNIINNYAVDGEIDTLILPHTDAISLEFISKNQNDDLIVEGNYDPPGQVLFAYNRRSPVLLAKITNYFQGEEYRHLEIQTRDGYVLEVPIKNHEYSYRITPYVVGRILPKSKGIQVYDAALDLERGVHFATGLIANTSRFAKIVGNDQINHLYGTHHSETILGAGGKDFLYGRGGDDTLVGGDGVDLLYGGEGNDVLIAHNDNSPSPGDLLYGEDGDDRIVIQTFIYRAVGGEGRDVYDIQTAKGGKVDDYLFVGQDVGSSYGPTADGATDLLVVDLNLENIGTSIYNNSHLRLTNKETEEVFASIFKWKVAQRPLNLQLQTLEGYLADFDRDGNTTIVGFTVPEDLNSPNFSASNNEAYNHILSIIGDGRNNVLTGNDLDNYIVGGAGNDTLYGREGNDILVAANVPSANASNLLAGGLGSDTYIFNGEFTVIDNQANDFATDKINLDALVSEITTALSSNGHLEILVEEEAIARLQNWTLGSTFRHQNILSEDNYVLTLDEAGSATVTGRNFSRETEDQTYDAGADTAHPTVAEITGGSGNDVLTANNLGNTLIGGAGNDTIHGGTGNDVFYDNQGTNILKGGDGSDVYLIYPGDAHNTIDNTATDGLVDIARLQANFADLIVTKQRNNLLISSGGADARIDLVVQDLFANDGQNFLQFATQDGITFSVTTDEAPALEISELNFSSNSESTNTDLLAFSLNSFTRNTVRWSEKVRLQDSPYDDTLKGNDLENVLISSQGQDYLQGREGQDVYFVSSQEATEDPQRLYPTINNSAQDEVEDILYLPDLSESDLVVILSNNHLMIGRNNSLNEFIPFARVENWSLGKEYQHLKLIIGDGVYHPNGDGTLQRLGVDFSKKSEGQTYDSLQDDHGGKVLSLTGSNSNDILRGDNSNNVFEGGTGRDLFEGRNGQDIYEVRGTTPGQDLKVILNLADDNQVDTIEIAVNRDELALGRFEDDLYLVSASSPQLKEGEGNKDDWEKIAYAVVQQFFAGDNYQHLHLRTADGENYTLKVNESRTALLSPLELDATDSAVSGKLNLIDYPDAISAFDSPGDDLLVGNRQDNIITSTSGEDRLRGRGGSDTYIIQRAEDAAPRVVTIDNRDLKDTSTDILYLDIKAAELQSALKDGENLILKAGSGSDIETVRILKWFSNINSPLQVFTKDKLLFDVGNNEAESYLKLKQVDFSQATSGQTFDASVNSRPGIDYSSAQISGTDYDDTLIGGSGGNIIISNGGNDQLKGGEGSDVYFIDFNKPFEEIIIDNYATDGLVDTVYLANFDYEEILPGLIGSDLYLGPNRIPQVRISLNDPLSGYFLDPPESEESPSSLRIKDWTLGDNYRHLQFVSADGVTFVLNESDNDFTVVGYDRRKATNDITIDLTSATYQQVETFQGSLNYANQVTGNDLDNTISGGSQGDILKGGAGNDQIIAGAGDDILHSGSGEDYLDGGPGDDLFYLDDDHNTAVGSDGNDTADYSESSLSIDVDLNLGVALKANNQVDYLFGIENVIAPNQNSILRTASDKNNHLVGGDGNDTLVALGGEDTLVGGGGTNEYYIRNSSDALPSNVTIDNLSSNAKGQLHLDIAANDLQELIFEGKDLLLRTGTNIKTVRLIDWFNANLDIVTKDGQLQLPIFESTSITLNSGAQLNLNADGTFTYNPNGQFEELAQGETVTDSLTYTIEDGQGGTTTATVTLVIQGSNDAPVALDKTLTALEDTASSGNLLIGVTDPEGDPLTITAINGTDFKEDISITLNSGALVKVNEDGTFTYEPQDLFEHLALGETPTDSFTYTIEDGQGGTTTATVTLVIQGSNDAPVALDKTFTASEDTATYGNLLLEATDPEGDTLTITAINGTAPEGYTPITLDSGALVNLNADGTFTYNPNGQFEELAQGETVTDSLTYTIGDGQGGTTTATATLVIQGSNNLIFSPTNISPKPNIPGDYTNLHIGDFNGDGKDDFLRQEKGWWADDPYGTANILLSDGDGTFTKTNLPENFYLNGNFTNLHIGDFNGDGKDDFLRQEKGWWADDPYGTANILLSDGDGTFTTVGLPENFYLNGNLTNLHIGDFNGDGKDDFLRQHKSSYGVSVFFSNGNGTFTEKTFNFTSPGDHTNLYVGDFNGDGVDDLLRQEKNGWDNNNSWSANIILFNGDKTFRFHTLPESLYIKGSETTLLVEDFNGDGKDDLLRRANSPEVSHNRPVAEVLLSVFGEGESGFTSVEVPAPVNLQGATQNVLGGDFSGSGTADFLRQDKRDLNDDQYLAPQIYFSEWG